jgi:SnoaL-like domain
MSEASLQELATLVDKLSDRIQQLIDLEEIRDLKARYFRLVDEQDWEAWRGLFTDDLKFDFGDGNWLEGGDAFVAAVREMMDGRGGRARSVHRGHMPELVVDSPTEAHGLWGLADYLEWPSDPETGERSGYRGYGHEAENYRKIDGVWKIATWQLSFIRMDPLPRQPLPETMIGGPESLQDAEYIGQVTGG